MPRRNSQAPTTLAAEEKFKRDAALAAAKFERDGKKVKTTSKRRTKTVTAGGPPPPPPVVESDDDDKPVRRPEHNHNTQTFKSYIIEPENYNLQALYKKFKNEKGERNSGYFAGSIILSALHEFEKRCNFYLNTTKHTTKKQLKSALYKDLELLKTHIEEM